MSAAIAVATFTACAVSSTSEVTSFVEDACVAEKADFDGWSAVETCVKTNPSRAGAALDAVVKAGAACTATERDGTCTSIEPVTDEWNETLRRTRFVCWYEDYCDIRGHCELRQTCCIENGPFPFPDWICGSRPPVLN